MIAEKVQHIIKQEKRNIVFYFHEDGRFDDELVQIAAAGIRVVEVSQNYFELKCKLELDWQQEQVFLFHPFPRPDETALRKYPLLDLLKANTELRLDDVSEFLSEYSLQDRHFSLVKRYIKQLKNKANQKKLARILSNTVFSEDQLKLGLISITLDFHSVASKHACMAKLLGLVNDGDLEKTIHALEELELNQTILKWFNNLLATNGSELHEDFLRDAAEKIKYNILTAYIDKPHEEDSYFKLKLDRTADLNKLQAFFHDWQAHAELHEDIDLVFTESAHKIRISQLIHWYGAEQEYGYYTEQMLKSIISDLYHYVLDDPIKAKDSCQKWLRGASLPIEQKEQVRFVYHTASLIEVMKNYRSFSFANAETFVEKYTQDLYQVDFHFRKAIQAFDRVRDRLDEFEETAMQVFESLNTKYDRFLIDLNVEWQKALEAQNFDFHSLSVNKQFDFYKQNIKSFEYKMVVIISDALRYELGYELYNDLLSDSKNEVTIAPSLASIPSYTNLGMANLLPNTGMSVEQGEADLNFRINGKTTVSSNREAILQTAEKESATIDFSKVMKFDRKKGREFFSTNRLVYIYHDWIDAIGDKKRTEHQTFDATTKAIDDIKRLIKKLYGWNVYYVLVTADHGFLFNYNQLSESSREQLPKSSGYNREHVRFVVAEEFKGNVDGYVMDMSNTTNVASDLKVAVPRAINRYRKQGNVGVQFVHGGASLQELVTPVVKFYKQKKDKHKPVTFKRIDQTEKIASGSLKISLLQDQPVSNEFKSAEVVFGLYSDTGTLLSEEVGIHFNSTSSNPKERIFEAILILNTSGSTANYCHLKAFNKNDKTRLNPLGVNDLLKITSIMEKDEWD